MADEFVYNYSATTREYLNPSPLEYDPLGGDPMVPANATQIAPPAYGENQMAVFNLDNHQWAVLPDFRGQNRYSTTSGEPVVISDIGALPPNTTDKPRPSANHVWNAQLNDWEIDDTLANEQHNAQINAALREIDLRSIAAIRVYLAGFQDAPQAVKDLEAEAVAKRAELIP